ncbi:cyanophycinase [Chryseobacterium lacus]|uniref:Cyanophycinase n=1 Tax=Chryseobacterium lacus TaxID=2058346 RepID=A0A368MYF4_9FLAO|nr:cyanophycinase [Chryseobacterium lacus]ODS89735.1 MAG: cyanophycinase [Chryseobacterium sp. SCN 40-13]RCU42355.1 cyanophycinase [Chryseobacterium lacus]RST26284.1 cyanophycinase [Chryseobacterium lacus]RST26653.1 cyanophycinase [Chryseobacterium lacus]
MKPEGKLMIIGGAVNKGSFTETDYDQNIEKNLNFFERGILRKIINESKNKNDSSIEIITTASQIPQIVGPEYKKAFEFLGAKNVNILDIETREQANSDAIVARANQADVVLFTGGDQLRLTSILGGTRFHDAILLKYQETDFLYAGTSAGAAAASENMIYQGSSGEALLKGEIKTTQGLGFIDNVIVDTHFVQRGRIGRLFQAVVNNPRTLGIGLGEDTGLFIKNDVMTAVGSGLVILVDGRFIKDTNLTKINLGDPVSIDNLVVHVMSMNDEFDLKTKELKINNSQYNSIPVV